MAIFSKNGHVSSCYLLPWTQECLSSAHAQTPIFTAGGSRCGFIHSIIQYIQLSGQPLERCPNNRGSTIVADNCTEVLKCEVNQKCKMIAWMSHLYAPENFIFQGALPLGPQKLH